MHRAFQNSFTGFALSKTLACALVVIAGASGLNAQEQNVEIPPPQSTRDSQEQLRAVQIEQQVKPAFLITPLVHRLQARQGQLLRFEFEIEAHDRPSRLEIRPVAMTQQENGVIMPDEQAPAPDLIKVTSDTTLDLTKSAKNVIRAEMRIPRSNAPFLSYGILAREVPLENSSDNAQDTEARVGIRFVTQYLLRVDVDVLGVKGDSVSLLRIHDGTLVQKDGRGLARVFVENPTDTAMEFSVNAQLHKESTATAGKKFGLVVPVRAGQQAPERYKARILAKTTLRLEEFLPNAVFPGEYSLAVELLHQNKLLRTVDFPVTIQDGDFPAQDARIVRVAEDITVAPAQLELSLRKGGRRIETLAMTNGSQQKITVQLSTEPIQGSLDRSLQFKPSQFELAAGQSRRITVTASASPGDAEHGYAWICVNAQPAEGKAHGTLRIPAALLTNSESVAGPTPEPPVWIISNERAGFQVPLSNQGKRHLPLNGRLTLTDEFGRGFVVDAGFGRWLLPGQKEELFFGFREPPPPGTYDVQILLNQNEGLPPLQLKQTVRLQSPLQEIPTPEQVSQRPSESSEPR